jgi:hypothetical protein
VSIRGRGGSVNLPFSVAISVWLFLVALAVVYWTAYGLVRLVVQAVTGGVRLWRRWLQGSELTDWESRNGHPPW